MNVNILFCLVFEAEEGYCGQVLWLYMIYFSNRGHNFHSVTSAVVSCGKLKFACWRELLL